MALELAKISVGLILPELKRPVTQEHVNLYARASGDLNPIHIDAEFAKNTPLGGTIAHGMLILAYVSEFMTENFGKSWLTGGRLSTRFKSPARPGDIVTIGCKITKTQKEGEFTTVYADIVCQNQKGETVLTVEARVKLK